MVSIRCKMVVKAALDNLGLHYGAVDLGEVEIKENPAQEQLEKLKGILKISSLELMDDKKAVLMEMILNSIIEMIHYSEDLQDMNFSDFLSEKLQHDYTYMAGLFSEATGNTIEHYIIAHKIEKVKELLLYGDLNLTEISYQLNCSSVAHLSTQFKKVTGLTPTYFKMLKQFNLRVLLHEM